MCERESETEREFICNPPAQKSSCGGLFISAHKDVRPVFIVVFVELVHIIMLVSFAG